MRGSLEGIGATLREEDGYIKVVKVIPGSAADRQGQLKANDVILAVGQGENDPVEVTDMRLRDAVALIRGEKGTEVRLTIRRPGVKNFVIPIVRDVVVIEESFVKHSKITDPVSGRHFGYIKVPSFYRDFESTRHGGKGRNSTDDVKAALTSLKEQDIEGLVLDLRNNGGGALTDAVGIAGLFLGAGPVVQVRQGDGNSKILRYYEKEVAYRGPLVVLVNHFSASASEIVAGALQDYQRAIIVGSEHTHGKGTVQIIMDLDESLTLRNMRQYMPLGALKMTTQKFYRVSGDSTQYRGIVPDIILPDTGQYSEYGERYLDYSLPWDRIEAIEHIDWPVFDREALIANSQQRVLSSEEFADIERTAEAVKDRLMDTTQSLRLEDVVQERKELELLSNNPHMNMGAFGRIEDQDSTITKEDKDITSAEKLLNSILKDVYIIESMAILDDLITIRSEMIAGQHKESAESITK